MKKLLPFLFLSACTLPINVSQPDSQIRMDDLTVRVQNLEKVKADAPLVAKKFQEQDEEISKLKGAKPKDGK